jgi:hypothetical protein
VVLWKADEPQSDEWLMVAKPDLPDDLNDLYEARHHVQTGAAFCSHCGRLWIAWGGGESLAEYVPADPTVRPVRDSQQSEQ